MLEAVEQEATVLEAENCGKGMSRLQNDVIHRIYIGLYQLDGKGDTLCSEGRKCLKEEVFLLQRQ